MGPELWNLIGTTDKKLYIDDDVEMLKKADVFALGITFYSFIFGQEPWEEEDVQDMIGEISDPDEDIYFPIYEGEPIIQEIVEKMTVKDYKKRITAQQALNML